jgi:hypothetical protein
VCSSITRKRPSRSTIAATVTRGVHRSGFMGPYFTVLRVFPPLAGIVQVVARSRHFSRMFRLQ